MNVKQSSPVRLAFWQDRFTILSAEAQHQTLLSTPLWKLLLYCRGRHAVAYLQQYRIPDAWRPRVGARVEATLRISDVPGSPHLHVQEIHPL